jgi:hypothetical protein
METGLSVMVKPESARFVILEATHCFYDDPNPLSNKAPTEQLRMILSILMISSLDI